MKKTVLFLSGMLLVLHACTNEGDPSGKSTKTGKEMQIRQTIMPGADDKPATAATDTGELRVVVLETAEGKPPMGNVSWRVYPIQGDGKPAGSEIAYGIANPGVTTLPAGRYLLRARLGKGTVERRFTVESGKQTDLTLIVGTGDVQITILPAAGSRPPRGNVVWRAYPLDVDGKPAANEIAYGIANPGVTTLPAGRYLLRARLGKGTVERRFTVKAGETTRISMVVTP